MRNSKGSQHRILTVFAIMIIGLIVIIVLTSALNSTTSTVVENTTNNTTSTVANNTTSSVSTTLIGNNSLGNVTKISTYGNVSSPVKIAIILGVHPGSNDTYNTIINTLENKKDMHYAYDIYMINTTNSTGNNSTENSTEYDNLNSRSGSLANEYAVPDMINNQYNLTMDVHSENGSSNGYVFVSKDYTKTSKSIARNISSNVETVGYYQPSSASYVKYVSNAMIQNNVPSIVYVASDVNSTAVSNTNDVLNVIDNFDFEHPNGTTNSTNNTTQYNGTINNTNTSTNNSTINNSSGNGEID